MATLMTNDAEAAIRAFVVSFSARRFMTAPEFSSPRSWYAFRDQYEQDYGGQLHPIRTQWFADMVRRATAADMDTLDSMRTGLPPQGGGVDGFMICMIRCIQQNLLEKAYDQWETTRGGSPAIPTWFRAQGWVIPAEWDHDRPPPARNPYKVFVEAEYAAAEAEDRAGR
jgi:hypothetical protein